MNINFLLTECTFLRYYMPLIEEANKRGVSSTVFVGRSGKYNCPQLKHNMDTILSLSQSHGFSIKNIDESSSVSEEIFFTIEGCGLFARNLKQNNKVYSMTYMTDYTASFDSYIDLVDHVIFPSFKFADHYGKISDKNLYLGSPKYCTQVSKSETCKKYNLNQQDNMALIVAPRLRDIKQIDLSLLYTWLKNMGYTLLVKTRGKDPMPANLRGDHYFEDISWYPHTTMELLSVSKFVVNFSSTVIKECVIMKKPLINFHIKPHSKPRADFLYDYSYCKKLNKAISYDELKSMIQSLLEEDHNESFARSTKENLFDASSVSKNIIDEVLK